MFNFLSAELENVDSELESYQRERKNQIIKDVCVCVMFTVSTVCVQGELRCWDLASLLFNEYLWGWQVHVQPFFYKLSNKQASPLSPTAITTVISRITLSTAPNKRYC